MSELDKEGEERQDSALDPQELLDEIGTLKARVADLEIDARQERLRWSGRLAETQIDSQEKSRKLFQLELDFGRLQEQMVRSAVEAEMQKQQRPPSAAPVVTRARPLADDELEKLRRALTGLRAQRDGLRHERDELSRNLASAANELRQLRGQHEDLRREHEGLKVAHTELRQADVQREEQRQAEREAQRRAEREEQRRAEREEQRRAEREEQRRAEREEQRRAEREEQQRARQRALEKKESEPSPQRARVVPPRPTNASPAPEINLSVIDRAAARLMPEGTRRRGVFKWVLSKASRR